MKVLLIGGTGVFGARLAQLLVADGHDLCIAARTLEPAQKLAASLGCRAAQVARQDAQRALIGEDVVIDAAGPFHSYGPDPYHLAKAALAAGVHYLDLSDNADFCSGITALDARAKAADLCVLSGLSSVPALSSAAVRALAGPDVPRVIDAAILPGNHAPRGLSVMQSILSQAGQPMALWRGGRWETVRGWSDPADYVLPGGQIRQAVIRQAWQIEVPDQGLFPSHFGAETVRFRAGLELGIMRYGLALFALLRRWVPLPVNRPVVRAFKLLADLLAPFGSGKGGMSVTVLTETERRTWSLLAEDGDGPFIPAIPARALLRRAVLPTGAGPAVEAITLAEAEAAMSDLRVSTQISRSLLDPIFPRVLGADFANLPHAVQATHRTLDRSHWQGRSEVRRSGGVWPNLLARLFRFPPASPDVAVTVTKTVTAKGECWKRRFGGRVFTSHLAATTDAMTERFGPFTFTLALKVQDGRLFYPVKAGRIGPLPLPHWLLPVSQAYEYDESGVFHFDVQILAPITQQVMVHYKGFLVRTPMDDPTCRPKGDRRNSLG